MSENNELPRFKAPEKKVDTSWKDEIRKERELAKQQAEQPGRAGPAPASAAKAAPGAPAKAGKAAEAPASGPGQAAGEGAKPNKIFLNFLTGLVQQAFMQLGLIENPYTGGRDMDLEGARYTIELLAVIQEKTKGNLAQQEERALAEAIRELKLQYVEITNEVNRQMQEQIKKAPPPGGRR